MKRSSQFYRKFTLICLIAILSGSFVLYYSCRAGFSQPAEPCPRKLGGGFGGDNTNPNGLSKEDLRPAHSQILTAQYEDLLPHLKLVNKQSVDPIVWLRNKNVIQSPAEFVLAIPTTHREQANYLTETLNSLLTNLAEEELHLAQFVIMIAERNLSDPLAIKFINKTIDEIGSRFLRYFEEGIIEVISPPTEWYPDIDSIAPTFNDSQLRTSWRAKQSLDYAFLMLYSRTTHTHAKYYVQLEDDIITVPKYITGMKTFAEARKNWVMLEFCNLGFIGKLFQQSDLFFVTQFILLLYRELPVDWILDQIFASKYCPRLSLIKCDLKTINGKIKVRRVPALFQHKGRHSSLPGKMQTLTERAFSSKSNIQLQKTGNPWPVDLTSNLGLANRGGLAELYNRSKPLHINYISIHEDVWFNLSFLQGAGLKGLEVLYKIKLPGSTPNFVPIREVLLASFYCFSLHNCVDKVNVESQADSRFIYMFETLINVKEINIKLLMQRHKLVQFTFSAIKLLA